MVWQRQVPGQHKRAKRRLALDTRQQKDSSLPPPEGDAGPGPNAKVQHLEWGRNSARSSTPSIDAKGSRSLPQSQLSRPSPQRPNVQNSPSRQGAATSADLWPSREDQTAGLGKSCGVKSGVRGRKGAAAWGVTMEAHKSCFFGGPLSSAKTLHNFPGCSVLTSACALLSCQ